MKVLACLVLLVAAVAAESMEESLEVAESYPSPVISSSARGQNYGAYGRQSSGLAVYGQGNYADRGRYVDRAQAARGQHDIGGYKKLDAYGAQASNYGRYRNVGSYAQDKGAGYEKAYAYDKKAGYRDINADRAARSSNYGVQDQGAYRNLGAYDRSGYDKSGARDRYGGQSYGIRAQDSSAYGRQGSSYGQMYSRKPVIRY